MLLQVERYVSNDSVGILMLQTLKEKINNNGINIPTKADI